MMKLIRPVLAVIILVLLLIAGAFTALPYIVSTDSIRLHLAQNISSWTGYNVEIRQPLRLKFFPVFRASLSDVTLSKISDATSPFMTAERIEVEMSPFDALLGRVAFTETRLINAHFTLTEPVEDLPQLVNTLASSSGRLGLAIRQARKITTQTANNADSARAIAEQLQTMPFGRLVFDNGRISFPTRDSEQNEQVSAINATINWPKTTSAATIKGQAQWHNETADYSLTVAQPLLLLANGISQINAQLTSKPLNFSFNGHTNITENLFTEGNFSLGSPSLSRGLQWLGLSAQTTSPSNQADDVLSIDANISATPQRIKLADIVLNLNGMTAKGATEISLGKIRPLVTGTFAFQALDSSAFLKSIRILVTKIREPDPFQRYAPQRMIDIALLNSADIDMRLSAQSATIGTAQMTGLAAALQIRDGQAMFDIGDAKAFKGSIQANINLLQDKMTLRLNAANIDSAAFLSAIGLSDPILTGQGNLSVSVETLPHGLQTMLDNARGQASFTLNNGRMQGFDLNDFIDKIKSEGFFALQRRDKVSLDFKNLEVKASLGDGVATLENTRIVAAQGILSLTGIIPLIDRSLALSGTLSLPVKDPAQAAEIQDDTSTVPVVPDQSDTITPTAPPTENLHFFVGGSWDRPFISPAR